MKTVTTLLLALFVSNCSSPADHATTKNIVDPIGYSLEYTEIANSDRHHFLFCKKVSAKKTCENAFVDAYNGTPISLDSSLDLSHVQGVKNLTDTGTSAVKGISALVVIGYAYKKIKKTVLVLGGTALASVVGFQFLEDDDRETVLDTTKGVVSDTLSTSKKILADEKSQSTFRDAKAWVSESYDNALETYDSATSDLTSVFIEGYELGDAVESMFDASQMKPVNNAKRLADELAKSLGWKFSTKARAL